MSYARLNLHDEDAISPSAPPLESLPSPSSSLSTSTPSSLLENHLSIRVLYKEKQHNFHNISFSSKIIDLKLKLVDIIDMSTDRMRFILAGKAVKEDSILLSSLLPSSEASYQYYTLGKDKQPLLIMHLFPLPVHSVSAVVPVVSASPVPISNPVVSSAIASSSGNHSNVQPFQITSGVDPRHLTEEHETLIRTVRMWCLTLLFLSMISIFNNFSFFVSTGKVSNSNDDTIKIFDTFLFIFDMLASLAGVYAGYTGLNSLRTMDLEDAREYIKWLVCSCIFSFLLRIVWVIDVILTVKAMMKEEEDHPSDDLSSGTDETSPISQTSISTFALQAIIIALIILMCWGNCMMRAYHFHNLIVDRTNYGSEETPRRSHFQEFVSIFIRRSAPNTTTEPIQNPMINQMV